jgi:chaperone BCS1
VCHKRNSLINLASLLNIIDGAASQEVSIYTYQAHSGLNRVQGRVLIMTTNHPQTLDPALIRPGRIHFQIGFTHATATQIRDILDCMYCDHSETKKLNTQPETCSPPGWDELRFDLRPYIHAPVKLHQDLRAMAETFARKLPENMFSPADIQGFLLERKGDPERALMEVEDWRDKHIRRRATQVDASQ